MTKKICIIACLLALFVCNSWATKVDTEKSITVNGKERKYILYVPSTVSENAPMVISLHGASGHDTDRSPFRTSIADSKGCIVIYPQGELQNFGPFGTVPGWNATGEANEEIDFFKAIIEDVAKSYSIDRNRIYCCGFSNGGMMTYAATSAASDLFAAFASISGFQLNEFHNRHYGARPVPFLHIHGKADDFVKYSCMPIIRDNMIARNGCNPVPKVITMSGKYRKSIYAAGKGGFPYVYYEVDGMGHNDFTDHTEDNNSALTMWKFMSQYTLNEQCDKTLKWRLNIDTEKFVPQDHSWMVNSSKTRFSYGIPAAANNGDNNVYPSLQFEEGNYMLCFEAVGTDNNKIFIKIETLDGKSTLFCKAGKVGSKVVIPFSVNKYNEYKITIVKESADDKFTSLAIHSCEEPSTAENCEDCELPVEPEQGYLIEIPHDQGVGYDQFTRTSVVKGDEYNTYTATGDLQIAIKKMDIDVKDCDYVIIKFAEPVKAGWKVAFWSGQETVEVPADATEFKFNLDASMMSSGKLPQICLMTLWGTPTPLIAKVSGIYKHCTLDKPNSISNASAPPHYDTTYTLSGMRAGNIKNGIIIKKDSDGTVRKSLVRI